LFTFTGVWTPARYIKASNTQAGDEFGWSVAVSRDGGVIAVGARDEDSATQSDELNNAAQDSGAVYVLARDGVQQGYIKASLPTASDELGWSLAVAADGSTLAAGATGYANSSGAAYLVAGTETMWITATDAAAMDTFGYNVALSANGRTLVVGAPARNGSAGAVYVIDR
jgi:hypothetical protein